MDVGMLFSNPYFANTERESTREAGSGAVGPEAIVSSEFPTTSDRMRLTMDGPEDKLTIPPPLSKSSRRRRVLISSMRAPQASRAEVNDWISAKDIPLTGAATRDEAPPEIRQKSKSFGPRDETSSIAFFPASRLRSSGMG